jgi:hypothetical protein
MVLSLTLELRPPISQYAEQRHLVFFEEWQNPVIENIRRCDSMLSLIEFGEGHSGIGIVTNLGLKSLKPPSSAGK